MISFVLRMVERRNTTAWRWLLETFGGEMLISHDVSFDLKSPEAEAFVDLDRFLSSHSDPVNWLSSQTLLVERVAKWAAAVILGPIAEKIGNSLPAVVHVILPPDSADLGFYPYELCWYGDRPLAQQGCSFVISAGDVSGKQDHDGVLRILAIMPVCDDYPILSVQRERRALVNLVESSGRSVDLHIKAYPATLKEIAKACASDQGWDIVHLSAHGYRDALVLQDGRGNGRRVSTEELLKALAQTRARLKLLVLMSCASAEGEPAAFFANAPKVASLVNQLDATGAALTNHLAKQLNCAVLAMRYPVADTVAVALTTHFYDALINAHMVVPEALQRALRAAAPWPPSAIAPPMACATPVLFGSRALNLRFTTSAALSHTRRSRIADYGLPSETECFIGQARTLSAIAQATAGSDDEYGGVILTGPVGIGKTATALEYAHAEERRFARIVWYSFDSAWKSALPRREDDLYVALEELAQSLNKYGHTSDAAKGDAPTLVILDAVERVLSSTKDQDGRWHDLLSRLANQGTAVKIILTARTRPPDLSERIASLPLRTLSLAESRAFARCLDTEASLHDADRATLDLLDSLLTEADGWPVLVRHAATIASGRRSRQLPQTDVVTLKACSDEAGLYIDMLRADVKATIHSLPNATAAMLRIIACLEPADRLPQVFEETWSNFFEETFSPHIGEQYSPESLLAVPDSLQSSGLVGTLPATPAEHTRLIDMANWALLSERLSLPRLVRDVVLREVTHPSRSVVDRIMGDYWLNYLSLTLVTMPETGWVAPHATLHALPYLVRSRDWEKATGALLWYLRRDPDPDVLRTQVVPLAAHIVKRTADDEVASFARLVYAMVLAQTGNTAAAESQLQEALAQAKAKGETETIDLAAEFFRHLRIQSRPGSKPLRRMIIRIAGPCRRRLSADEVAGPPIPRPDELLAELRDGRYMQALKDVELIRQHLRHVAAGDGPWGTLDASRAAEMIHEVGYRASMALGRWEDALTYCDFLEGDVDHRASSDLRAYEIYFWSALPLIELGRIDLAREVLLKCVELFANEPGHLGDVFDVLARLDSRLQRWDACVDVQRNSLGYFYAAYRAAPSSQVAHRVAEAHHVMGAYLMRAGKLEQSAAHLLVSAMISGALGDHYGNGVLPRLAECVRRDRSMVKALADAETLQALVGFPIYSDTMALISTLDAKGSSADPGYILRVARLEGSVPVRLLLKAAVAAGKFLGERRLRRLRLSGVAQDAPWRQWEPHVPNAQALPNAEPDK